MFLNECAGLSFLPSSLCHTAIEKEHTKTLQKHNKSQKHTTQVQSFKVHPIFPAPNPIIIIQYSNHQIFTLSVSLISHQRSDFSTSVTSHLPSLGRYQSKSSVVLATNSSKTLVFPLHHFPQKWPPKRRRRKFHRRTTVKQPIGIAKWVATSKLVMRMH